MTKLELIKSLDKFPDSSEIVGAWDSGWAEIDHVFFDHGVIYLDVSSYNTFPHPSEEKQKGPSK